MNSRQTAEPLHHPNSTDPDRHTAWSLSLPLALGRALCWGVPPTAAQVPPGQPGAQVAEADLLGPGMLLRDRLLGSGMTPEAIRAALRTRGFPRNLLDEYLVPDSLIPPVPPPPTPRMQGAVRALGIGFSVRDSLILEGDSVALRLYVDSLRADSIILEEELARQRRPLVLFGLDVFRQATTQFQPLVSGPVDDRYQLGPGDELLLILSGDVERSYTLEVTRDGSVVIPQVAQLFVSNLTLAQLREQLYDVLARRYSGITRGPDARTLFNVTVTRVRVTMVRVVGEVARPGSYQIAATAGVLQAIYEAGGLTQEASFRGVQVRRGRELVASVDLYDFLTTGVIPNDVMLGPGDAVFVPPSARRVKLAGEVVHPAIYEFKPGETLLHLIGMAGGLTPEAAATSATIDRIVPLTERRDAGRTREVLTVNLAAIIDSTIPAPTLLPGDSVTIFSIRGNRRLAVSIKGSVWQPGTYRLEPGMRLSDLIEVAGGLRPETYRGRVQVLRTLPDSTTRLLGASLAGEDDDQLESDLVLAESDEVTVFTTTEFRPARYVTVFGAVQQPRRIPFADSMTLRDAVLLAGGLLDNASLTAAEISRLRPDTRLNDDSLALVLTVPLDSSYVVDETGYIARAVGTRASSEVRLHPYDNVFIRQETGWQLQRNVIITGEVRVSGVFSLVSREERLADLVRRAGGLTRQAYPNGVRFFRARDGAGRIPIDLESALADAGHRDNILLVDGDSVHIPPYISTVRVEGAINFPSSVAYVPNRNTDYYVTAAGGYSATADKGKTFVQQPSGIVVKKSKKPEPGAVIVVPEKPPGAGGGFSVLELITSLSTFLTASFALIAIAATR